MAISDTHSYHSRMELPAGDVLIHGGDIVGNYGKEYDIAADMRSFVSWLYKVAPRYTEVVFVAGNHDTLLDPACSKFSLPPSLPPSLALPAEQCGSFDSPEMSSPCHLSLQPSNRV